MNKTWQRSWLILARALHTVTRAGLLACLAVLCLCWPTWAQTLALPRLGGAQDLAQARIGVLQGSAHDQFVQKAYPQARLFQFVSVSDMVLAVDAGQVDAGIMDEDGLEVLRKEKPQLVALGPSQFDARVGAGFNRHDPELRQQFNAFLAHIKANGTYDDMIRRWMKQGRQDMPALTFNPKGAKLRVAMTDSGLPSVATVNGKLVGFDVEIALRFAQHIGRQPELMNMNWNAVITALVAKKVDTIISSMYITPERQQRIDFSDPYYVSGNYFFTLAQRQAERAEPSTAAPPPSDWWGQLKSSFYSNIIHEDRYLLLWDGLWVTIQLSILSVLLGTALGAGLCAMRMSSRGWVSALAQMYISALRGTPVLVLLMIIFYVVFASVQIDGVYIAVLAFGMNFGAYSAEIFRSGVQSIDHGQTEAGVSMGFTPWATFVHIVLPQTVQRVLPVYKGEFISLVKMTSIVGYVAVQDLTKASDIIRSRTFDAFFPLLMVGAMYFLISWALTQSLEYLERRTDPMRRRGART
jgi:polar amino acid transport system substrate-binding protein